MTSATEPNFSASEQAVLDEIGRHLHARGWAGHVTVEVLLQDWEELSTSVNGYKLTIDDYTNDLTSRDALKTVLAQCPEPLRTKLRLRIERADSEFAMLTKEDVDRTLGRYFQITDASDWWWKRKPADGPLAAFLST
jgi:hypothetical protein